MNENEKEKIKEEFCPVCLSAVPLAFSMVAGANEMINNNNTDDGDDNEQHSSLKPWYHNHRKNRTLHICIVIAVIALAVIIYYKFIKNCDDCK
jgi:hypothetical protein